MRNKEQKKLNLEDELDMAIAMLVAPSAPSLKCLYYSSKKIWGKQNKNYENFCAFEVIPTISI